MLLGFRMWRRKFSFISSMLEGDSVKGMGLDGQSAQTAMAPRRVEGISGTPFLRPTFPALGC